MWHRFFIFFLFFFIFNVPSCFLKEKTHFVLWVFFHTSLQLIAVASLICPSIHHILVMVTGSFGEFLNITYKHPLSVEVEKMTFW